MLIRKKGKVQRKMWPHTLVLAIWFKEEFMYGTRFMSRADFRMERSEKNRDNIGMEGRQATLPRESSTQEDDRDWSQGRVSIPLDIIQSIRVNWSVDSIDPTMDFSSFEWMPFISDVPQPAFQQAAPMYLLMSI